MNTPGPESRRTLVIKPTLIRCMFTPVFFPALIMFILFLFAFDLRLRGAIFIRPMYICSLVLLFLLFLFRWLQTVSYCCFVTAQQMWIEQGILWKTTKFYELYRIRDYTESRSILDRILGTMQLRLFTMDTNPFDLLELKNIPHSSIAMQIRDRVQQSRKTNKMLFIENDAMR